MNSTAPGFSVEYTMIDDSYFNISKIKQSITSLFSVQIMSYLGASDIIYNDVIDSFFSEILKYKPRILNQRQQISRKGHRIIEMRTKAQNELD